MDLLIAAKKIADSVEAESLKQNVPVAVTVIERGLVLPHAVSDHRCGASRVVLLLLGSVPFLTVREET